MNHVLERIDELEPSGYRPEVHARRWTILFALCLALIVIVIDNTILNVALPELQRSLGASASDLQWIVDAYVLTFAGLLLIAGNLGDRRGRRGALLGGLALFGASSAFAMAADSAGQLIAARAAMGAGAAFIMPGTLSILTDVFVDRRERAKAIGIWSAVAGIGVILGPVAGGSLLEHFSWSSVFFVNVPIVAVTVGLVIVFVPTSRDTDAGRLDTVGGLLSIGSLAALLYAIIEAPHHGWTDATTLAAFALGIIGLVAFVVHERIASEPLLPLTFFADRRFAGGAGSIAVTFFALFGALFVLTTYLQVVLGYTSLQAGLRMLPMGVIAVVAPIGAAVAQRVGPRRVVASGAGLISLGLAAASQLTADSPYWPDVAATIAIIGTGMGLIVAPSTEAVMSALPPSKAGVGSAVNDTTREIGGALGVAVVGSVLSSVYADAMADSGSLDALPVELRSEAQDSVGAASIIARSLGDRGDELRAAAVQSFTSAMEHTLLVAASVAAVAAVLAALVLPGEARDIDIDIDATE
jgi:EmrB/QacA subfamily drug resistance transporter